MKITQTTWNKRRTYYFFLHLFRMFHPPTDKILRNLSEKQRKPNSFLLQPSSLLEEGRRLLSKNQYTKALAVFSNLIQKNPENEWAWHGKGDAFQFLHQYPQAEHAYRKAIAYGPQIALHWGGLANALFGQEKYSEAEKIWKKTQQLDPSISWMRPK